ncbi:23S rRNA (pseudouridine(1915)-N(3))-methyltransferase RlmH [Sulfuriflexus sp.]|uniref:23S rRNA (pseudouridine(1915)-N(3))-methyltransferase RlmH n=1 Tax=Sulfuriflexus sp. TaxID=2015443 RepID=UPI0028CE6630|nr:23S rRNA (pseudouridine(1915)-N(3))-methyltransferase RlmH [Sulfuriflexus sp.]MDT8404466.1 23S rRNA (pseudouridine(1915)-N(3))-methyltransferase RlmH [Sulfuriflexus sp.]
MRIHLIAVGQRMPDWVNTAYQDFARRLPGEYRLNLVELAAGKRGKNADIARAIADEGKRMLDALPKDCLVITLDEHGRAWSTMEVAGQLADWSRGGRDVALLIGGADGLAAEVRQRADMSWSLSNLTLPHALVRVVLAEQLYRAWSLLTNHPYHRA